MANKRMNSHILNPRILILSGSAGFFLADKKIVSIHKLIAQEENYVKILLDLIKNIIKPNLIIIEKTMPFVIIEELSKMGIGLLQNVKKKVLKLISRLTSSKILSSINQFLYQNSEFVKLNSIIANKEEVSDEDIKEAELIYEKSGKNNCDFQHILGLAYFKNKNYLKAKMMMIEAVSNLKKNNGLINQQNEILNKGIEFFVPEKNLMNWEELKMYCKSYKYNI
jgi:hypothetical protein